MLEGKNQETQNKVQESPQKTNMEKEKKSKALLLKEKSKYIATILLNFNISEQNKKVEEMLSDLELFRSQYNENQEKNAMNIENEENSTNSTKLLINNALEKHLIEISYIKNKEIRTNRINSLYIWYKERIKISEDLKRINAKTYNELNEIDEEEFLKDKGKAKEEEKNEENEENEESEEDEKDNKKIVFKKINPRNEELINKKMLEDYQRKILSKSIITNKLKQQTRNEKSKNENMPEKTTESAIMGKTISVIPTQDFWRGDMSTFYSNKNSTNITSLRNTYKTINETKYMDPAKGADHINNFFPKYDKGNGPYFPPLNRETKFSYSYHRPQYDYNTMVIENQIKNNKLKLLSEKRSQEEIKENIDKFGIKRAKYKEEMNNKYELKSVINMYVNNNDLNTPLLEKYKTKSNSMPKNKAESVYNINNKNDFHQTMSKTKSDFIIGFSSLADKNEKMRKMNSEKNLNEESGFLIDDNKIEKITPNGGGQDNLANNSKRVRKIGRSSSQKIFVPKKLFRGIIDKIKVNDIKNIDKNTKNILEPEKITKIKFKLKLPKEKIQSHLIKSFQKKSEKISSDAVGSLIHNDSLFKEKRIFESICNINMNNKLQDKSTIDNKSIYSFSRDEDESSYHNFCLSMYDLGNLKKIDDNNRNMNRYYGYSNLNKNNLNDSKIHLNKLHRTYHLFKDNYLNLRRTMSDWKTNEYINLVNKIKNNKKGIKEKDRDDRDNVCKNNNFGFRNIRIKKSNSLLNAMVNPKDEFRYSQYFLPRSGSMLLSRIEDPTKAKKKK